MHTTAPYMQYLKKNLKEPLSLLTKRSSMIKKRVLLLIVCCPSKEGVFKERVSMTSQACQSQTCANCAKEPLSF